MSYTHIDGSKEAPLYGPTSDFKDTRRHRDADQLPAKGDTVKSQAKPQLLIVRQYTNQYVNKSGGSLKIFWMHKQYGFLLLL